MGLVFVLGFLVMFWSALPGWRPVVVAACLLGSVLGVLFIQWRRWRG